MFEKSTIETFMGGEFNLRGIDRKCKVQTLAAEIQKWADEIRSWDNAKHDVMIGEVAIVKDRMIVTLAEGISQ